MEVGRRLSNDPGKELAADISKTRKFASDDTSDSSSDSEFLGSGHNLPFDFASLDDEQSIGMEDQSIAASTHIRSLKVEKEKVDALLKELEEYEHSLAREHTVLELEKESLEFQLDQKQAKIQELREEITSMEERIKDFEESAAAAKTKEEQKMANLQTQNEILRQRLERQEAALMNLHSEKLNNVTPEKSLHLRASHLMPGDGDPQAIHRLRGDLLQANAKLGEKQVR